MPKLTSAAPRFILTADASSSSRLSFYLETISTFPRSRGVRLKGKPSFSWMSLWQCYHGRSRRTGGHDWRKRNLKSWARSALLKLSPQGGRFEYSPSWKRGGGLADGKRWRVSRSFGCAVDEYAKRRFIGTKLTASVSEISRSRNYSHERLFIFTRGCLRC